MTLLRATAALRTGLMLALIAPLTPARTVFAQTDTLPPASSESKSTPELTQTIFLVNATQHNDLNDIVTDLRNMLPRARTYAVASQSAITIRGTADEQAQAQRLITQLDRPRESYRLTYTFTEYDGGKSTSTQHISLVLLNGSRTTLKQGTRVPIVTGNSDADTKASGVQVQYIDVGLNIEASIAGTAGALSLETRVEQSSLAQDRPVTLAQDPMIHQASLNETAAISAGKPLILGSLDLPGSTRRLQVEVVAEPVH